MANNNDDQSGPVGPDAPADGPPAVGEVAAPSERPASRSTTAWSNPAVQAGAALAAIVLIAIVGTVALGDNSTSTRPSAALDNAKTTTTLTTTAYCTMELAGWLDFAVAPGGSLSAAGAEFGLRSPEYIAVETAWSKFAENTYVIGADRATTIAVESLAADCDTIGDAYLPGHIAPN